MFKQTLLSKARRNRVLVTYAHNYTAQYNKNYNKKYNKKPFNTFAFIKGAFVLSFVVLSTLYMFDVHANSVNRYATLDDIGSGQLLLESAETIKTNTTEQKLYQPALLLNSAASFDINGILATVTVTQSFINTGNDNVNGLYTFPLPENSAVNYLKVEIGDREIEGKIVEKHVAKKLFNQAKALGKKASLVEQHRPNLFTNKIANIAPNEQLTVTLKYVQTVDYVLGEFSLRFPMNITPRYVSVKNGATAALNQKPALPALTALPLLNTVNKNDIHIRVNLNAGIPIENVSSPSHLIKIPNQKLSQRIDITSNTMDSQESVKQEQPITILVGNVQVPMDKDFILQWRPIASSIPQLSVLNQTLDGEEYALALLIPPTLALNHPLHHPLKNAPNDKPNNALTDSLENSENTSFARDITFIIDTSGSMQGESIKQAKQSLRFAINSLKAKDSFNIIAFSSNAQSLFTNTRMTSSESISKALAFISKLTADGGTEMYQPLKMALNMKQTENQHSNAIRQVLFITDGAVSDELSLFKLIKNTKELPRLFTVGIGSAPNGYFMRKAAEFGQGSYTFIGNINEVEKSMSQLLHKISHPVLTNIKAQFLPLHVGAIAQYPDNIPDLYEGEPLLIAFKTTLKPNSIQLFGDLHNEGWQQEIAITNRNKSEQISGITSVWARAKIEDLLDGLVTGDEQSVVKKHVIETSLKHQVMSPYTSFIAVEERLQPETHLVEHEKKRLKASVFPQTSVGWQAHLLIGLGLFVASFFGLLRSRSIKDA